MLDLFFKDHAAWFGVPAIAGTLVFLLRIGLLSLGHAHIGLDHDGAIDAHGHVGDSNHDGDSALAFKILSIQTIAAFAMGFGWGGLGVLRGTDWSPALAVPVGIGFGVALVWVLAIMLKGASDLQTSGNIRISDTVGATGTVYVTVPPEGTGRGQVQVVVNSRQRIYNAVTLGPAIGSHASVRVTGVNDDNTLTVQAI